MIKLYTAKTTDFTQADYTKAYGLLERTHRDKINAKKYEQDKKNSLAALILLYRGVYECYGKTQLNITFNRYGKPLCDFCFFSISHSKDRVACVLSDEPVGVDIEHCRNIKKREKYKFFNEKECRYVNRYDGLLHERYNEIFTKKEAALKMLGLSVAQMCGIDTFSNKFYFETLKTEDYTITVCRKMT